MLLLGLLAILLATLLAYPLIFFFSRYLARAVTLLLTLALVLGAMVGLLFVAVPILTVEPTRLFDELPVALSSDPRLTCPSWWRKNFCYISRFGRRIFARPPARGAHPRAPENHADAGSHERKKEVS